jgi:hypothetical protein
LPRPGVEVPALHLHDDAMQGAVAHLRERLQQLGDLHQERIAIVSGERRRGGEDRHHLTVGQGKSAACGVAPRRVLPGIRDLASLSKILA